MKNRTKYAGVAAVVLAATVIGGGITQAQAANPASPASTSVTAEPTGPDTDNLQQGDQSTPDTTVAPAASTVANPAAAGGNETTAEGQGESESPSASDGPGGHEDPPGDVQHEGGAGEQ